VGLETLNWLIQNSTIFTGMVMEVGCGFGIVMLRFKDVDLIIAQLIMMEVRIFFFHINYVLVGALFIIGGGLVTVIDCIFINCKSGLDKYKVERGGVVFPGGYGGALFVDVSTNITSCLFDCCYGEGT
jgi:hypothetical protein